MLVVVLIVVLWCVVLAKFRWLKPGVPSPPTYPGSLPLIGNAHQFIGDATHFWKFEKRCFQYALENGGIVKLLFCTHKVFVITDPDESLIIANTCLNKTYFYEFAKEMYNRGLVTASESTWKPHRRLLNPAFNQQVLNTFLTEFNEQARNLVSSLEPKVGKAPFNVQSYLINNLLKMFVFSSYSKLLDGTGTSLGLKEEDQSMIDKDYVHATENLFALFVERVQTFWLHLPLLYTLSSLKKKQDKLMSVAKGITNKIIKKRKSELKVNSTYQKDNDPLSDKFKPLLDQMLDLAEKQDAFTDDEIREHLDTIVAAAYDTTATSMTYTLLFIGSDQELQQRIYKELKSVLGDEDRDLTKDDLPKLVYLEAVLKESLRLYPPVPVVARAVSSDIKLRNYIIPAGSSCFISLYGINRHPMWGADAEEFRPERWLDPASLPDNPNAFASFSLGKRNCLGRLYGTMVMKTTLAHVLRRYRVIGDINKVFTQSDIMIKPVTGHDIRLELRK